MVSNILTQLSSTGIHFTFFCPLNSEPLVNALVDERFAAALQEAHSIDRALDNGEQVEGSLLGVPFTGKDSHSVKGLSWTAGILAMKVVV